MKTLDKITKPLAIAMWDSCWIRRRYRGGGFEDWDKVLTELTERGYNAVRIDAFPHLVACGADGNADEIFKDIPDHSPNFYGFGMWGAQWTNYINPRKSLPEFIRKCAGHGVWVALTTWLKPEASRRNEKLEGAQSVVRIWDETLRLLEDEGCLDNVLYLDFLNELPDGFCMQWFHDNVSLLRNGPKNPGEKYNLRQKEYVSGFIAEAISGIRKKWPGLPIAGSIVGGNLHEAIDASLFDYIDSHVWANYCKLLVEGTDYRNTICKHGHPDHLYRREPVEGESGYAGRSYKYVPQDCNYDTVYGKLLNNWKNNEEEIKSWLRQMMQKSADLAAAHGVPVGSTEGWGLTMWAEHPLLGWDIHREAAEFCVSVGKELEYLFNCTSNFCHPHHIGYWEDTSWHRRLTDIIKS